MHENELLQHQAELFKALGNPSRLKIAKALLDGERCVCELQQLVGSDMSTVSKHLSVLKQAGIISSRRQGTSIYYCLKICCLTTFLDCTAQILQGTSEKCWCKSERD